ncbi:MAG: hypothetical protein NTX50_08760, partial [Candidatus Sumerlaeota bacterium]|nr:hypothetical protein [Candidatus Sumerlaeota bacterium]
MAAWIWIAVVAGFAPSIRAQLPSLPIDYSSSIPLAMNADGITTADDITIAIGYYCKTFQESIPIPGSVDIWTTAQYIDPANLYSNLGGGSFWLA